MENHNNNNYTETPVLRIFSLEQLRSLQTHIQQTSSSLPLEPGSDKGEVQLLTLKPQAQMSEAKKKTTERKKIPVQTASNSMSSQGERASQVNDIEYLDSQPQPTSLLKVTENEFQSDLITAIQKYPAIWNLNSRSYRELPSKSNAWVEVGKNLNENNIDYLKKTWEMIITPSIALPRNLIGLV